LKKGTEREVHVLEGGELVLLNSLAWHVQSNLVHLHISRPARI
jgi:hypothetical protein